MRLKRFGGGRESRPSIIAAGSIAILLSNSLSHATPVARQSPPTRNLDSRGILDDIVGIFDHSDVEGYAPTEVDCPTGDAANIVRSAGFTGPEEVEWLEGRKPVVNAALTDFLSRLWLEDFDVNAFMSNYTPVVSMAFSGGGYRAMLNGAGVISAFDARTPNSTKPGGLGGLLQGTTYLAGLSGGSWLVGSMSVNGFPSIAQIQNSSTIWDLEHSIISPRDKPVDYYPSLIAQVNDKNDAGFDVTLTDLWSVMLSRQFIDKPDGGPNVTFSQVATSDPFTSFQMPFPIFVADGRAPGETLISLNTTVFEINPIEFGSHDPTVYAFTKTKLLGSDLESGRPQEGGRCTNGFDSAAFMMGTSSSLFNSFLLNINEEDTTGISSTLMGWIVDALEFLSREEADIADWTPNPFYKINPDTNPSANSKNLTLVDGGLDLENIPLNPLLVPHRHVDVIFANDNSADVVREDLSTVNWPNGTALVATYERAIGSFMANGTNFPAVPAQNSFVNLGLNARPTWFGCDAKNFTGHVPPLLVYIPNAPYTYFSNKTTFTMSYETADRDAMISNGFLVATQGDGFFDSEWSACVGCAVIHREMERRNATTAQCNRCLERYCWDGSRNDTLPITYEPKLKMVGIADPSIGMGASQVGTLSS
ncbi:Lysophospholipase [Dactylella cylindrospora]|nr:Lysophospholipase [Dactylella cylindrospora]